MAGWKLQHGLDNHGLHLQLNGRSVKLVLARRRRTFPLPIVRDLLGLTRALYRAECAKAAPDARLLEALTTIGEHLNLALDLGKSPPDTMGSRAAWSWAERAATALEALVHGSELSIAALVRASIQRLER